MDVKITPITEVDALLCQYPGQHGQQPTNLELDLEDGELTAGYNPNIGGMPESVYNHRTLWVSIPCLTADAANALMEEIKPLAQRILDGSEIEWNGNNHVGELDADARAAYDELIDRCDPQNFDTSETAEQIDAGDWFGSLSSNEVISQFDLTADTTDEEIAAKAKDAKEEATANGEAGYLLLTGAEEYLTGLRDELRQAKRDELEDVAEQLGALTERRDDLIRQIRAWDTDSDRTIGALAGLSHTAVQKIAVR